MKRPSAAMTRKKSVLFVWHISYRWIGEILSIKNERGDKLPHNFSG